MAGRAMTKPMRWLIVFTFAHGLWYALIVHPWQAPDEFLHYEYLRLMDADRTLDLHIEDRSAAIQWPIARELWTYEHFRYRNLPTPPQNWYLQTPTPLGTMFQPYPPLYYLISMPFYWITANASPSVQLYALRLLSVLLHCLTVWLVFKLAELVFNNDIPWAPLAAASAIAILPQYTFISASYNNDTLAPPLVAASLLFLIRGYQRGAKASQYGLALLLGLLALATKRTAIGVLPVLAIGLLPYCRQWYQSERPGLRALAVGLAALSIGSLLLGVGLIALAPMIPAGLARQVRLQPDALVQLRTQLLAPSTWGTIHWGQFFEIMLESSWAWFGWLTVRVAPVVRTFIVGGSALLGILFIVAVVRHMTTSRRPMLRSAFSVVLLLVGTGVTVLAVVAQYLLNPAFYTPQGRYLFPFLPAMVILATWSWLSLWPPRFRSGAGVAMWVGLAALDAYAWAYVLLPAWYS